MQAPASDKEHIETVVQRLVAHLSVKSASDRQKRAEELVTVVHLLSRQLAPHAAEPLAEIHEALLPKIASLLQSKSELDQLGALAALNSLIELASEAQIIRFANYLRNFFAHAYATTPALLAASKALGKLASSSPSTSAAPLDSSSNLSRSTSGVSGTIVAASVDFEITRAFEWLQIERHDAVYNQRRLAACFVLRELALSAATLFHVHLPTFFQSIWGAVRDPRTEIREAATSAVSACLELIAHRRARHRVQWYCQVYDHVFEALTGDKPQPRQRTLSSSASSTLSVSTQVSPESVHGSLLVLGEMLHTTGGFMLPRFREVCDVVLMFKDDKNTLVNRSVCLLLPQLAAFCPGAFVHQYLDTSLAHLLRRVSLHTNSLDERGTTLAALGKLSLAVGGEALASRMDDLIHLLLDSLSLYSRRHKKRSRHQPCLLQTLECISQLAQASGDRIHRFLPGPHGLVEAMVQTGLSDALIQSLGDVASYVPPALAYIQERLLREIWTLLSSTGSAPSTMPLVPSAPNKLLKGDSINDVQRILLSLRALGGFDFSDHFSLLAFVRDGIALYLSHPDARIRDQAVVTCCQLLLPPKSQAVVRRGPSAQVTDVVLTQVLTVGISDPEARVRRSVLQALCPRFDQVLSQESHLTQLFTFLNDEVADIRDTAMGLIGRVADKNPAFVLPPLRRLLIQLLTELQHTSDMRIREESTRLLGSLVRAGQRLVDPYMVRLLQVLLPNLVRFAETSLANAVLVTVGELSAVARTQLSPYEHYVFPLVIDMLQEHVGLDKRQTALRTLAQVAESTGNVVRPYLSSPTLLGTLLKMIQHTAATPWPLRRDAMKTIGVLGALDPYKFSLCTSKSSVRSRLELKKEKEENASHMDVPALEEQLENLGVCLDLAAFKMENADEMLDEKQQIELQLFTAAPIGTRSADSSQDTAASSDSLEDFEKVLPESNAELDPTDLSPTDDSYFPTVAIHALLRILKDPSLGAHHHGVIQAIMFIFKSLSTRCVPFLKYILPPFLKVLAKGEQRLRESLFLQLTNLVAIVGTHMRPFFPSIVMLALRFWDAHMSHIVRLLEHIATAAPADFRADYLPQFLPRILQVLEPHPELLDIADITGVVSVALQTPKDRPQTAHATPERAHLQVLLVQAIIVFGDAVQDYVYLLVPALVSLLEAPETSLHVQTTTIYALARLSAVATFEHYAGPRILQPLARVVKRQASPSSATALNQLSEVVLFALCALAFQLQHEFLNFQPLVQQLLSSLPHSSSHVDVIDGMVQVVLQAVDSLRKGQAVPPSILHDRAFLRSNVQKLQSEVEASKGGAAAGPVAATARPHVNQQNLRRAWEASQRSTKEDWLEWMRRFSIELLRESPSPALRACCSLAQVYNPLAMALFNSAFVSCWSELYDDHRDYLVVALKTAFRNPTVPAEILQTLLNLAEFMEHDFESLPIEVWELARLAQRCHAYAKALHYKELEFHQLAPPAHLEELIATNNQLGLPEAAVGILKFAQQRYGRRLEVHETWFEKLREYQTALELYEKRIAQEKESMDVDAHMGKMRCLEALGQWEDLAATAEKLWQHLRSTSKAHSQRREGAFATYTRGKQSRSKDSEKERQTSPLKKVAMLGARASWWLSHWDKMEAYVAEVTPSSSSVLDDLPSDESLTQVHLYRSVLAVHRNEFSHAESLIDEARQSLDAKLGALVGESYSRAYRSVVTLQQLSELQEIVEYKKLAQQADKQDQALAYKQHMVNMWNSRLGGCKKVVDVWHQVLAVRSLVLPAQEDVDTWLEFASLCRRSDNLALSFRVFTHALGVTSGKETSHAVPISDLISGSNISPSIITYGEQERHRVAFAYLKQLWAIGDKSLAISELQSLLSQVSSVYRRQSQETRPELLVKCQLKMAEWQLAFHEQQLERVSVPNILSSLKSCTELEPRSYKAWHAFALMNFHVVEYYNKDPRASLQLSSTNRSSGVAPFIAPAMHGFFRSIALGRNRWAANVQQDILRVLTLWIAHGHRPDVQQVLTEGFQSVSIETWLIVIPQLIARIQTPNVAIQKQLHTLLTAIGAHHPHALIYPLSVALKSPLEGRQQAAETIMNAMRRDYVELVDQALLVSRELIRVAILWHEMWHEGLDEASRLYFGEEHDVDAMVDVLLPLHDMMEQGPETLREHSFQQTFGRELREAGDYLHEFLANRSRNEAQLNRAWDLYYHVFRRITKQLQQLTTLELQYVSPSLLQATNLTLAVPGTYRAGHDLVTIRKFHPTIQVIASKQRPRRITMAGSNGYDYMFLLKGHEDLRQDERVTQLFGLVNALLINDPRTAKKELKIHRFPVIPLSHNVGIIGWVPHCDTLHQLIRDYREARKVLLNIEHRLMQQMAPHYDALTLLQKVEVFEFALENTAGQDLYNVLWLKSQNSEVWLDRRTTYTRSLAVMSMVGYMLGLGDRHPSNLMLHRFSGTIVHIDFGDCFEVAMHRDKYPEKIPFRLTRMLVSAMEASGIEGNFRFSCERVMQVLRENRHSLMAMLEAFVHDPLIRWRLLTPTSVSPTDVKDEKPRPTKRSDSITLPPKQSEQETDAVPRSMPTREEKRGKEEAKPPRPPLPPRPTNSNARPRSMSQSIPVHGAPKDTEDEEEDVPMEEVDHSQTNLHHEMSALAASLSSVGQGSLRHAMSQHEDAPTKSGVHAIRSHRERELMQAVGPEGSEAPREALNERAVAVIRRVQAKLTGRDFDKDKEPLDVPAQVDRLIHQATSHENLCQCYIGWCPFW